ncbi:N-acetylmuramoyl-L-alanine amidase [Candidatus Tisiphia endosymbiont of Mystacides longicornis]|uniref:N-acetylmuramoyl-L-alanine amidase n=1 Tax=Candidatus Tisiphia endosymbiont of Mystacides longicornis TaxID=3139330 RepID=UPI003CCA898A
MSDNNINTTYLRTNYDIPPDPQAKPEAGKCNNYNLRKNNGAAKWIVMHYTECDFAETIALFTRNTSNVSSHYVINTDGTIYRLVPDQYRAWHAGRGKLEADSDLDPADPTFMNSKFCGVYGSDDESNNLKENSTLNPHIVTSILDNDMNSWSIGIEHIASGKEPFTDQQIDASIELVKTLVSKYEINPKLIIGHSDWAPGRKIDPGIYFPWDSFAKASLGLYSFVSRKENPKVIISYNDKTKQDRNKIEEVQKLLEKFGYPIIKADNSNLGLLDEGTISDMLAFNIHYTGDILNNIALREQWDILWNNSSNKDARGILATWSENSENVLNDLLG